MKNGETETTAINCRLNGFESIMIASPRLIIIEFFAGQSDSLDILRRSVFDQTAMFFTAIFCASTTVQSDRNYTRLM